MHTSLLKKISLGTLICTVVWLVFFIWDMATAGPLDSFELVLAHVQTLNVLFYLTYINATLVTFFTVMFFGVLYLFYRQKSSSWAFIGMMFIPIYGVLNVLAYVSQITVVPQLLGLSEVPQYHDISLVFLRQLVQIWPRSAVSIFNNFAYAVLAVPSIIFGVLMTSRFRLAGLLLLLNGISCIVGFIGIVAQCAPVGQGSILGGILFLFALVALNVGLTSTKKTSIKKTTQ